MLAVHVRCEVLPERIEEFRAATLTNARASVQEPGILRFDVLEEDGAPGRFLLVEVYRTPQDAARHKETAHYETWRDAVAEMMAEPRSSVKYGALFPSDEEGWAVGPASTQR